MCLYNVNQTSPTTSSRTVTRLFDVDIVKQALNVLIFDDSTGLRSGFGQSKSVDAEVPKVELGGIKIQLIVVVDNAQVVPH